MGIQIFKTFAIATVTLASSIVFTFTGPRENCSLDKVNGRPPIVVEVTFLAMARARTRKSLCSLNRYRRSSRRFGRRIKHLRSPVHSGETISTDGTEPIPNRIRSSPSKTWHRSRERSRTYERSTDQHARRRTRERAVYIDSRRSSFHRDQREVETTRKRRGTTLCTFGDVYTLLERRSLIQRSTCPT